MAEEMEEVNRAAPRRWLYGANLVILLVIAAVIVGLLMYMTADKATWKKDFTKNGMYSLSGYTRQLLKQVDEKGDKYELISLFQLDANDRRQNENVQQVNDLVDEYSRASSNITYKDANSLGAEAIKQQIRERYGDEIKPYTEAVASYKKLAEELDKFAKAEAANIGALSQGDAKLSDEAMQAVAGVQSLFSVEVPDMLARNKQALGRLTESTSPDWGRAVEVIKSAPPQKMSLPALESALGLMSNPAQIKELSPGLVANYMSGVTANARYAAMHAKVKSFLDQLNKLKPLQVQDKLNLQPNTLLVLGPHSVEVIPMGNIYKPGRVEGAPGQPRPMEFAGEEAISSALLGMVQPDKMKVVFITSGPTHPTTNNGADGWSDMAEQLRQANFEVLEWNPPAPPMGPDEQPSPPNPPAEGKGVIFVVFPADVDQQAMMAGRGVNAGPVIQAVRAHLDAGGQALFLADGDSGMMAMMGGGNYPYADLLKPFGVEVHTKYLVVHNYPGPKGVPRPYPRVVVSRYEDHEITRPLQSLQTVMMGLPFQNGMGFLGAPTVVNVAKDLPRGVDAKVLMYAADDGDTWGETKLTPDAKFDKGEDYGAPVPMAVAASKTGNAGDQRVVVIGSRLVGSNDRLEDAQYGVDDEGRITSAVMASPGNMELVRNSVFWLAGYKNMIAVGSKSAAAQRIVAISPGMLITLRTFLIAVMPLGALVIGGIVWFFRRR